MERIVITVDELKKIYKKNEKRVRLRKPISEFEIRLTAAAAHAIDLINTSNLMKGKKLDFSDESIDNLQFALVAYGMGRRKSGKLTDEEWLADMIKKAASFEMFYLYESLNQMENISCEFVLPENSTELALRGKNAVTGAEATINMFDAYRRAHSVKPIFILFTGGEISVYSGLACRVVLEEFLTPLGLIAPEE